MSRKFTRFLSLILSLALLLSFASCKKTDKKPISSNAESTQSNVEDNTSTPDDLDSQLVGDVESELEEPFEEPYYEEPIEDIDPLRPVVRPETDEAISVGIKLAYAGEEDEEILDDEELEGEGEEDWEIGDDIADEFTFEKIIEPYGTLNVNGKKRAINVDNSKDGILFTGFTGISTNVYPTQSTLMSQQKTGDRDVFVEINGDRFNNMKASYARSWFQIDWMMTNECAEKGLDPKDFKNNWEENPDYVNYYNGKYSFDNNYMNSCIEYWKALEEAGTEIYLAFGWKIANRIQGWFSSDMRYARESAPRDLDAYADAAVALYKYVRNDVGLTNFGTLSFYNEPNWNAPGEITYQDFCVSGDKRVWWMNMVKKCRTAFDNNGLEDVIIACADHTGTIMTNDDKYVSVYIKNHIPELVDMWSFHIYPGRVWLIPNGYDAQYEILCDAMRYVVTLYGENSYITEYYGSVRNDSSSPYSWDTHGWDTSNAAFLIAAANNGVRGNFHWGFTGGYLCDPLYFDPANGSSAAWLLPKNEKSVNDVKHGFYEVSLMNNYIPKNANVHNIEWAGDDIRASAFTSKDGKDFTLLVEAAENSKDKIIDVTLSESLGGRDLNVFYYDFDLKYTANAIIPTLYDTIKNIENEFTYDEIDGNYGIYLFTTLEPVEQIALFNPEDTTEDAVYNYVAPNGEVSIKPELIDSNKTVSKDTVVWDIKRYSVAPGTDATGEQLLSESLHKTSNKLGILKVADDGTVTYKPRKGAKVGDIIAIRCTLKSDSDVWASAIIEIKN